MLYEDRMAVATPEGVTLEFTLAGVGSRFVAALLDALIQGLLVLAVMLLFAGILGDVLGGWGVAVVFIAGFLVLFGYDIAFETLASGRTLGKRWTGLRVVKNSGAPVTFTTSAVRNLMRLVDILPTAYLVGIVTILATSKNQRLGDLAAGTIVVRERTASAAPAVSAGGWAGWTPPAPAGVGGVSADDLAGWDVSQVTPEEVAAVRQFLARRGSITYDARRRLGWELANRLRPKVAGPPDGIGPENFLEALVAAKSSRT
jgi:uncharacterized RDD family membrane protein YckC